MEQEAQALAASRPIPACGELLRSGRLIRRLLADGSEIYQVEKETSAVVRATSDLVTVTASDGSVDRYGDIVDPHGWELDQFRKNPVILVDHDYRVESIVGHSVKERVTKGVGSLELDVKLDERGTNAKATMVRNLIENGSLRTVSVGFAPREYHAIKQGVRDECPRCVAAASAQAAPGQDLRDVQTYGLHFTRQELLETSFVAVPANPNATVGNAVNEDLRALLPDFLATELASL